MNWGESVGLIVLTTVAGGTSFLGCAALQNGWYNVSESREGQAGVFIVIMTLLGLAGGFLVGLGTALAMRSAFWPAQIRALEIVAALTVLAGIFNVATYNHGEKEPKYRLALEVELKCPAGWKPDHRARATRWSCGRVASFVEKWTWEVRKLTAGPDERWVVPCAVFLPQGTRGMQNVRIRLRRDIDATIGIRLPRTPGPEYYQWSEWSTTFVPGKDSIPGCAFRFRLEHESDYETREREEKIASDEARQKAVAALPPGGPIAQWLPFFEDDRGERFRAAGDEGRDVLGPAEQALNDRPEELASLLGSGDEDVVQRAVICASSLKSVPESLIGPLAASGRHTIDLIREARAASIPGDPDPGTEEAARLFYLNWLSAMRPTGNAGIPARRAVTEEIERELRVEAGNRELPLAERVRKDLSELACWKR